MKPFLFLCLFLLGTTTYGQAPRQAISESEAAYLIQAFETMTEADQRYRSYLTYESLDDATIARIDSIMEADGVEAGLVYHKRLNLSLSQEVKDSIHALQHQLDFQNHMMMRGIWEIYGFIPEEIAEEHNYIQLLLLVHPQKDWDISNYHERYAALLRPEVDAGRMPAKTYATFYDNILCKILREPQLYGTNEQFDIKLGKVLPPKIGDLSKANAARAEIGLPELKAGEYRLAD